MTARYPIPREADQRADTILHQSWPARRRSRIRCSDRALTISSRGLPGDLAVDLRAVDQILRSRSLWKLAASEPGAQEAQLDADVFTMACEALRIVTVLAHPIIPDATQKIWEQLGQSGKLGEVRDRSNCNGVDLSRARKLESRRRFFRELRKRKLSERIETMENEIRNPGAAAPAATSSTPAGGATPAGAPAGAVAGSGALLRLLRLGRKSRLMISRRSNCEWAW